MGLFERIKTQLAVGRLKKEQVQKLRVSIWKAIADGEISDPELIYINSFFIYSELSTEEFRDLKTEIFALVVAQAIADKRVTEREFESLGHIIRRLELSPEIQHWAQEQVS